MGHKLGYHTVSVSIYREEKLLLLIHSSPALGTSQNESYQNGRNGDRSTWDDARSAWDSWSTHEKESCYYHIARKFQISLDLKKKKRKLWELVVCIASNTLNMF